MRILVNKESRHAMDVIRQMEDGKAGDVIELKAYEFEEVVNNIVVLDTPEQEDQPYDFQYEAHGVNGGCNVKVNLSDSDLSMVAQDRLRIIMLIACEQVVEELL